MSIAKHLVNKPYADDIDTEPIRNGFGRGLVAAGKQDERVVALCADLTDSTRISYFKQQFPERFIEVGVAEQNLVTVASGLAAMGKIPFTSSYAAFSPGRNWEQIRTTICLNEQPVKIVGSHAGVSVGLDGATHQMLEDIALMRVLPHMVVVCPADSIEAAKATVALAQDELMPAYIRLAREATPVFTTEKSPFNLHQAQVFRKGDDVSLLGTGTMTYQLLYAADVLAKQGIEAEVVHVPVVKPIDQATILASVKKTNCAVTAEEAQIAGGFGGAVAELLSLHQPAPLLRIGIEDRFGESGEPNQLLKHFGLDALSITQKIQLFLEEAT